MSRIARRELAKGIGAAVALGGCTRAPAEEIVAYVEQPPEVVPGRATIYASAFVLDGYAKGILVECHEGRPTKIEGNPDHPASLGASGIYEQAFLLDLYDESRLRGVRVGRSPASWQEAIGRLDGGRLAIVLPPTSSPAIGRVLDELRGRSEIFFHGPASRRSVWEGAKLAFGRVLEPRDDLSKADVVVALDADLFERGPAALRMARQFASRRSKNRLYVVEPRHTATGIAADHRLRVRGQDVLAIAAAILHELGAPQLASLGAVARGAAGHAGMVRAIARDLDAHRGRAVVVAGDAQPPLVHALAHAINARLGTLSVARSPIVDAGERSHDPTALARALNDGGFDAAIVLGTNLVYASPADLDFATRLRRVPVSAYLGLYDDETAAACTIAIGEAHPLETWGDARAFDGTLSVVQPVIRPLHDGRSALELLAALASREPRSARALVRASWSSDESFRAALRRGTSDEPPFPLERAALDWASVDRALAQASPPRADALEILFPVDERVHDGRFSRNRWLLELPTAVTKLTWTNAATFSPATAARLGLADGDEVEIALRGRSVKAATHVVPGQADRTVALSLGWGRDGRGTNAFALLVSDAPTMDSGAEVRRTGARRELPRAQTQHRLLGRDAAIARHEPIATRGQKVHLPLYQLEPRSTEHQWAMAIDLSLCTGCSACVVACQAENNVPTVGPEGVAMGRIMHWLRIDTYFIGEAHDPSVIAQPMLCQHCEKAPCEYVCPVNATVHSADGLNQMTYNRCVGTRFCSNNCPYKVRRFNWFDYHEHERGSETLVHNPDVTVRERGVIEKCTFCVQRIREQGIRERTRGDRSLPVTACQQACPTGAIVFGDLLRGASEVARLHRSPRAYGALEELGTKPRVAYLARVKNPNPEVA